MTELHKFWNSVPCIEVKNENCKLSCADNRFLYHESWRLFKGWKQIENVSSLDRVIDTVFINNLVKCDICYRTEREIALIKDESLSVTILYA